MTDYYFNHLNSLDNTGDVSLLVKGNKAGEAPEQEESVSPAEHAARMMETLERVRRSAVSAAQRQGGFRR
ncbi:hypothetical protein HGP28_06840 [Vibrio sp. SM6]|uniref:Uncharacterized protein n=1 Tax=Vibrio agarilyticus TaxID=2726741 RepID=A0A7X8TPY1_9VIBR|nr:hypothetical protein [Vibrio agarilyticus]NLS12619.1 hypothetical protein [Vibrio agarilyticus]